VVVAAVVVGGYKIIYPSRAKALSANSNLPLIMVPVTTASTPTVAEPPTQSPNTPDLISNIANLSRIVMVSGMPIDAMESTIDGVRMIRNVVVADERHSPKAQ
jgi:hypothetical protein